jgi:hypothetical protein
VDARYDWQFSLNRIQQPRRFGKLRRQLGFIICKGGRGHTDRAPSYMKAKVGINFFCNQKFLAIRPAAPYQRFSLASI